MLTRKKFKYLFDTHAQAVFSFLSYYNTDSKEREDWVQEVFLKVWENREKIDADHPRVKGYLLRVARNHAISNLRTKKSEPYFDYDRVSQLTAPGYSVDGSLTKRELSQAYDNALNRVPNKAKKAFKLSRDEELTYNQIADTMGVSSKTVERRISQALKVLRVELKEFRH